METFNIQILQDGKNRRQHWLSKNIWIQANKTKWTIIHFLCMQALILVSQIAMIYIKHLPIMHIRIHILLILLLSAIMVRLFLDMLHQERQLNRLHWASIILVQKKVMLTSWGTNLKAQKLATIHPNYKRSKIIKDQTIFGGVQMFPQVFTCRSWWCQMTMTKRYL